MYNTNRDPIFIIGNPRSGTTLMRLLLTCHSNICIPPECGWIIGLCPKYKDRLLDLSNIDEFLSDLYHPDTKKFETWLLKEEDLRIALKDFLDLPRTYTQVIDYIYSMYSKLRQDKALDCRWGDKNNFFLHHIYKIKNLFPAAKILFVVRDGRDVACSYREVSRYTSKYSPKLPTDIEAIASRWKSNLLVIEEQLNSINYKDFMIVRYEDLVSQPYSTVLEICRFLNEPYENQMFEYYKKELEPHVTLSWKQMVKKPISKVKVGRYKKDLTSKEIKMFEFVAEDKLKKYGYRLSCK